MRSPGLIRAVATATFTLSMLAPCVAQSVAEFYKGKTISLLIGYPPGGGYDAYARILARHMGKYIPGNPAVVAKNMEGGGGIRLANFLYNAGPKDGTAIGTFNRGTAFDALLGSKVPQFDATKYVWIGSTNNEVSVCVSWHTTGITDFNQLRSQELLVGATSPSADTVQFPKIVNAVLGTKFKPIAGYPGGADIDLAMERGEVQGRCGWSWTSVKASRKAWLDEKKINLLVQIGLSKHVDLPKVPLIMDLAKKDEDRAIFKLIFARQVMAWPYVAPPGIPRERTDALRTAFNEAMKDKDLLADAAKGGFDIEPVSGEEIQNLVQEIYATPAAVAEKTIQLLQ
jgi:hypothetical protein